jgi:hypothetical protein
VPPVCPLQKNENKLARRWFACMEQAWQSAFKQTLTPKEIAFRNKVEQFQNCADFGRFRVYGEIRKGRHRIILSTEFQQFCDNEQIWKDCEKTAKDLDANIWIMREDKHSDHVIYPDTTERFGPNHGRMERQVEFSWRIETLTIPQLKKFIRHLTKQTQSLWDVSGVGVM